MVGKFSERDYWLAFSVCNGIGPVTFQKLLDFFATAQDAWYASKEELKKSGLGEKSITNIVTFRNRFSIGQYLDRLQKAGVWFATRDESVYPALLKKIKNPPIILYGKGNKACLDETLLRVAVVGTRHSTDYGRHVTQLLVSDLVASNCVIVSGLAMGVDAVAHQTALHEGGKTIAVLGSGVDLCTPQENISIYSQILKNSGLILSEYPLGTQPSKGSFPARNRIIAGLSEGVVVTEGARDSGSLITAHDGFANNRNVFAVPGPITSTFSHGPIQLIAQGATMVKNAQDILNELGLTHQQVQAMKKAITGDTPEEKQILVMLQREQLSFDAIVKRIGLPSSRTGSILSLMELKGFITQSEAGLFSIST